MENRKENLYHQPSMQFAPTPLLCKLASSFCHIHLNNFETNYIQTSISSQAKSILFYKTRFFFFFVCVCVENEINGKECSNLFEAIIKTKVRFDRHGELQRKFISPTFNAICTTYIIDTLALQIGFFFTFIPKILKQKAK